MYITNGGSSGPIRCVDWECDTVWKTKASGSKFLIENYGCASATCTVEPTETHFIFTQTDASNNTFPYFDSDYDGVF